MVCELVEHINKKVLLASIPYLTLKCKLRMLTETLLFYSRKKHLRCDINFTHFMACFSKTFLKYKSAYHSMCIVFTVSKIEF